MVAVAPINNRGGTGTLPILKPAVKPITVAPVAASGRVTVVTKLPVDVSSAGVHTLVTASPGIITPTDPPPKPPATTGASTAGAQVTFGTQTFSASNESLIALVVLGVLAWVAFK